MDSDAGSGLTSAQKDALMEKVKQEIMIANFQELLQVSLKLQKIFLFYFEKIHFWNLF